MLSCLVLFQVQHGKCSAFGLSFHASQAGSCRPFPSRYSQYKAQVAKNGQETASTMYSPPTTLSPDKLQSCAIERISMRFFRLAKTTFRQRVRAAQYLEQERRTLTRLLGFSTAVDVAIARNIPAGDLRLWFKRMSHRHSRIRLMGVSHGDVIKCFCKASIDEVRRNPHGPWRDIRVALALVSRRPAVVQHLPEDLRDIKRLMWKAVSKDGSLIEWASARLRADTDMVIHAVRGGDGPTVLQHVPAELLVNREVALAAVEANGRSIQCVDESFCDDDDIIMAASFDFPALPLASPRIRERQGFVHNVCRQCRARVVGPNLMSFIEDTEQLTRIAAWLPDPIILCRIRLLSGRAALTSFSTSNFGHQDWRRDFLALHLLFEDRPERVRGHTICNGFQMDLGAWRLVRSLWYTCGLKRNQLNEISLVRTDC